MIAVRATVVPAARRLAAWACAAIFALLGATACAASAVRPDPLAARFARSEAQRARALAPDLHARAERAHAAAIEEEDSEARADRALQAELLLDAAIAEAARIEHDRAAEAADARAVRATEARAQLESERRALERQLADEQRARSERAAAADAFRTAADPGAARAAQRAGAQAQAADALLGRARLTLAAALALGASETRAAEVEARIAAAAGKPDARTGLAAAEAALLEADRALGEARLARSAGAEASGEETAELLETARERGLAVELTSGGAAIDVAPLFAAGSEQLTVQGRARLAQLVGIAAAHPRGELRIEHSRAGGAAGERRARGRAQRIARALANGTGGERVRIEAAGASESVTGSSGTAAESGGVRAVFTAYRATR